MLGIDLYRRGFRLYCRRLGREIDVLYAFLMLLSDTQFFPEMYDIFGDKVWKFLEIFGGQVIRVPDKEKMESLVEKISIWCDFQEGVDISELSKRYRMDLVKIRKILDEVNMRLKVLGVSVVKD